MSDKVTETMQLKAPLAYVLAKEDEIEAGESLSCSKVTLGFYGCVGPWHTNTLGKAQRARRITEDPERQKERERERKRARR